eukprot:566643-Prymnesium_polylepis.2
MRGGCDVRVADAMGHGWCVGYVAARQSSRFRRSVWLPWSALALASSPPRGLVGSMHPNRKPVALNWGLTVEQAGFAERTRKDEE